MKLWHRRTQKLVATTSTSPHSQACVIVPLPSPFPSVYLFRLQIIKQVKKLVYVKDVSDITSVPYVARELMLVKVGGGRGAGGRGGARRQTMLCGG